MDGRVSHSSAVGLWGGGVECAMWLEVQIPAFPGMTSIMGTMPMPRNTELWIGGGGTIITIGSTAAWGL